MQLILFLLDLLIIGCVLYGIAVGAYIIQRRLSPLAGHERDDETPPSDPAAARPQTASAKERISEPQPSAPRQALLSHRTIIELRELFALYRQGALTQEKFKGIKQCLLAIIYGTTPSNH